MRPALIQRLRAWTQLLDQRLGRRHWFQHVPLALLLGRGGLWILNGRFGRRLEPICARPDGGRFPPESQVVAFPANWRRHGYHGPWPAVALASGLGDGGPASCHWGSEHTINRAFALRLCWCISHYYCGTAICLAAL